MVLRSVETVEITDFQKAYVSLVVVEHTVPT